MLNMNIDQTKHHHNRLNDYTSVLGVGIEFAFQPIVDLHQTRIIGYEALVRGRDGESASNIIDGVRPENLAYFDQACRNRAIQDASKVGITNYLFLNCTQITPERLDLALSATSAQCDEWGISPRRITLEFSNLQRLGSPRELAAVRQQANACGFRILSDNFGKSEAGLKRLAVFRPELLKLDRELIDRVASSQRRKSIVLGVAATCRALDIDVIATGVERAEDINWLTEEAGIRYFQGYYFGRPQLGSASQVEVSAMEV